MKYNLNEISFTELLELKRNINRDPRMRNYKIINQFEEAIKSAVYIMKREERLGMGRISLGAAFVLATAHFSKNGVLLGTSLKVHFEILKSIVPEYSWKDVLRVVRSELNK